MTRATYPRTDAVIDTGWRYKAICYGTEHEAWGSSDPDIVAELKAMCGRCPAQRDCLADALATERAPLALRWGIRGGLTAQERAAMTKSRRNA